MVAEDSSGTILLMRPGSATPPPAFTSVLLFVVVSGLLVFNPNPAVAQTSAAGDRLSQFDIDPLPGDGNKSARGVCSDGSSLWVVEERALKLYAYTLTDAGLTRDEDGDIQLDVYKNYTPAGCVVDGATIWVADDSFDNVLAYNTGSGDREDSKDFSTLDDAGNNGVTGVTMTDSTLWVADYQDKKLYGYDRSDGQRDTTRDISLHSDTLNPVGLWTDGSAMWVADNSGNHFYAYDLATGERDSEKEFPATDVTNVQGIWSNGAVLWAANRVDRSDAGNKVMAYRMPASPSSDATLSNLTLTDVTLAPSFASETTSYSATVPHSVTMTTVTAAAGDASAETVITPADSDAEADGHQVPLAVGATVVSLVVTAQDGETTRTYEVTVTRAGSSDATLSELLLTEVTLTPSFASETTSYSATVPHSVTTTTVTAAAGDANAEAVITPADSDAEADGHQVPLAVGETVVSVAVTAQDGETTRTYEVTVTRAGSSDATLSGLSLADDTGDSVALSPSFSGAHTKYTAEVANSVTSVTVTAEPADTTSTYAVQVDGQTDLDGVVPLAVGETVVSVMVTAQDGETTRTYEVTVMRVGQFERLTQRGWQSLSQDCCPGRL